MDVDNTGFSMVWGAKIGAFLRRVQEEKFMLSQLYFWKPLMEEHKKELALVEDYYNRTKLYFELHRANPHCRTLRYCLRDKGFEDVDSKKSVNKRLKPVDGIEI